MRRVALCLLVLVPLVIFGACDNAEAPVAPDGSIVLRFDPAPVRAARVAGAAAVAAGFDSVVVNVYRPGSPPHLEVSRGRAIIDDSPIDISLGCIAEEHKQVAVNLYVSHLLVYHGYNSDVDVTPGRSTAVTIDVSAFFVTSLTLTPGVIPDGAAFTLHWPPAPAAASYRLEESATLDFAQLASTQAVHDTTIDVHVAPGSHYFRVRPMTAYASGLPTLPKFGYVAGGSYNVQVTGVDAAVIPGETITIAGENLDFPGTKAAIGARSLTIESVAWNKLVARVPRNATTDSVMVTSLLGSDTSDHEVVVQRVAYVTSTGEFASAYIDLLAQHSDDFGKSGVVEIPVAQLDTRDMSVFDIIIIANDTGDTPARWAGKPARYSAITTSGAGVLALGQGGASFLRLATGAGSSVTTGTSSLASYYTSTPSSPIFTTPHTITSGTLPQSVTFCNQAEPTLALSFAAKPSDAGFYAETGLLSNQWVLADLKVTAVRYIYWGYEADPEALNQNGQNLAGNAMNLLFADRPPLPATVAAGR